MRTFYRIVLIMRTFYRIVLIMRTFQQTLKINKVITMTTIVPIAWSKSVIDNVENYFALSVLVEISDSNSKLPTYMHYTSILSTPITVESMLPYICGFT